MFLADYLARLFVALNRLAFVRRSGGPRDYLGPGNEPRDDRRPQRDLLLDMYQDTSQRTGPGPLGRPWSCSGFLVIGQHAHVERAQADSGSDDLEFLQHVPIRAEHLHTPDLV